MSYSKIVTYEAGSNGDAITTTNTGSDTLRQTINAGTATISTAQAHGGTRSLHMVGTSTNGLWCVEDTLGALTTWTDDFYLYVATLPSAETTIRRLADSGGAICKLGLNGVGALIIRNSSGTSLYSSPSGKRITAGSWVHIVWEAAVGASGTQRVRWYPAGSGVATDDSTTLTSNNGTGNFSIHRRGAKCETSTATVDLYFDDETMSGASAASSPTAAFTFNVSGNTVDLDASGSSAILPATIANYAWSFGDSNSGSGSTTSHTYATPGTYTVDLMITDSNGLHTTVSQSITITSTLPVMYVYHSGAWVSGQLYLYHSGQWVVGQ